MILTTYQKEVLSSAIRKEFDELAYPLSCVDKDKQLIDLAYTLGLPDLAEELTADSRKPSKSVEIINDVYKTLGEILNPYKEKNNL